MFVIQKRLGNLDLEKKFHKTNSQINQYLPLATSQYPREVLFVFLAHLLLTPLLFLIVIIS